MIGVRADSTRPALYGDSLERNTYFGDALTLGTGPIFRPHAGAMLPVPIAHTQWAGAGPNPTMAGCGCRQVNPCGCNKTMGAPHCSEAGARVAQARWAPWTEPRTGYFSAAGNRLARCRWGPKRGASGMSGLLDGLGVAIGGAIDWISGGKQSRDRQARDARKAAEAQRDAALAMAAAEQYSADVAYQIQLVQAQQQQRMLLIGGGVVLGAIALSASLRRKT